MITINRQQPPGIRISNLLLSRGRGQRKVDDFYKAYITFASFVMFGRVMSGGGSLGAYPLLVPKTGIYSPLFRRLVHTTIGCGKQGFPSAQPYLSHTPAG